MASYCTVDDVRNIVPKNIIIGTNVLRGGANVLETQVDFWIDESGGIIDAYLASFYRTPFMTYKEPDWSQTPVTFTERYPHPLVLINARLAAANIFDRIIMANQEPNVSEWGKNQRALAFDDLKEIQTGLVQLRGQIKTGMRFVRRELLDNPRAVFKTDGVQSNSRAAGI